MTRKQLVKSHNRHGLPLILLFFVLAVLMAAGCASHRRSRGKLSDALGKASNDYQGDRTLPSHGAPYEYHQHPSHDHEHSSGCLVFPLAVLFPSTPKNEVTEQTNQETETPPPLTPPEESRATDTSKRKKTVKPLKNCIFFSGGTGAIKGDDFNQFNNFQVGAGRYLKDRIRFEIYGGGGWADIRSSSKLDQSIDNSIYMVTIGVNMRYFLTPRHTFLGPYVLAGLGLSSLSWTYENPITIDNETLESDRIAGLELYTGLGVNLMQFERVQIGAEIVPGMFIWENQTAEGFDNDVFGPFYYVKMRATCTFLF